MKRTEIFKLAAASAILLSIMGVTVYAQEKYSLVSPGGIAFSDFQGYED